jgi:hypothetical protein
MLSREIERRLDRLLAVRDKGVFTDEEFAARLGDLLTTDNIGTMLDRLPPDLIGVVKKAVALDNRRAADNECLQPEASPLDWLDVFARYYRNVAGLLLEPDKPRREDLISVVCLPSFQVEWALRLLGSERKGHSLALSVAEAQIWSYRGTSPIAVKRSESPLALASWLPGKSAIRQSELPSHLMRLQQGAACSRRVCGAGRFSPA